MTAGGNRIRFTGWYSQGVRSRLFRAGETPLVPLAAVWAGMSASEQGAIFSGFLGDYLPMWAWAAVFSLVCAAHLVALLDGGFRLRAAVMIGSSCLWATVGIIFTLAVPSGVLGPTLLIIASGGLVTSGKLLRMLRDWPL